MTLRKATLSLATLALCVAASSASAFTPAALRQARAAGQRITVVDVRPPADFARAHIPGALNVPLEVLGEKRLPPLGRVAVCGDGILPDRTREAVALLNAKRGIRAEILEGGFAGWESADSPSTRAGGVEPERLHYVTYSELMKAAASSPGVVLVDLRHGEGKRKTDLAARFPTAQVVRPGPRGLGPLDAGPGRALPVVIDDGNGSAETLVRRLKAAGIRRVAILLGGEGTLEREGSTGLKTVEFSQ